MQEERERLEERAKALEEANAALSEVNAKLSEERERYRQLYMELLERCKLLEKGIIAGSKAERFVDDSDPQLSLKLLGMLLHSGGEPTAPTWSA